MSDTLTFAACTFTRVFDTRPLQDALTLNELTVALTRFELKPKVLELVEREERRADAALAAWRAGEASQGKTWSKLEKAASEARRTGGDVEAAVVAAHAKGITEARKSTKREIRLWSPALYRTGGRRETNDVVHLSCLVLDYDAGLPPDEASALWAPWYHVLHTTWSHTVEQPKFRVVLPLLNPVLPEDWYSVYDWALDRAEGADPTGKSVGSTFALPVVPNRAWPREARVNRANLLDPLAEGLVDRPAPIVAIPRRPEAESFLRGADRDHPFIAPDETLERTDAPVVDDDDDPFWDPFGAAETPGPVPVPVPAPASAADPLAPLVARLEAVLAALERERDATFVDALERLVALYDAGALDDDELQVAKGRLLRGEA